MRVRRLEFAVLALLACSTTAAAQTSQDLKRISLEELLEVPVSIVARAPEPASAVPAAAGPSGPVRMSAAAPVPQRGVWDNVYRVGA